VIYIKGFCSWFVKSITGLISILISGFSGVIKCIKEWLVNIVIILKAWSSIKGLKVVRNAFKDSCS
jgi:ABC-type proline/glycine betaine transport system permease subunit